MGISFRPFLAAWAIAGASLAGVSAAWADQMIIPGAPAQQVTFIDFADDKLIYQTRAGDRNDRELSRINHIVVDGETALNEAEVFFSKDEKEKSVDGYMKTIRATSKPWVRVFASKRLLEALGNAPRFDARLVAYLAVLTTNPDAAGQYRPELPDKGNKQLDTAVTDVENTLKQPNLPAPQQVALYSFLIELHRQRGDEAAATATLERLAKLADTLGDMPEVRAQLAGAKVAQAKIALEQKKYSEATKLIDDNRGFITDPRQQSDALFVLAQAKLATVNKNDKNAMKDVAIMFMRVVAHFSELEGKPNVLASLKATAGILDQVDDKDGAAAIREQIKAEFPEAGANAR